MINKTRLRGNEELVVRTKVTKNGILHGDLYCDFQYEGLQQ